MPTVWEEFGVAVAKGRAAKKWTLSALAEVAFGNADRKGYVSQIEKGRTKLHLSTVQKLATALALPDSVTDPVYRADLPTEDEVTQEDLNAERLISMTTPQPSGFHPAEALLIALAYQYAPGSEGDLVSASNGLRAALDTAAKMQRTARLPHNAADQVDAVLAELEKLNAKGELDAGAATLATARTAARDRIAEETSGLMRLLDSTVAQARLRNAPKDAADALVEKLLLDDPPDAFDALRKLQDESYILGRDQGLAFDATVAIHLSEHSLTRAQTSDQRGTALNDLGIALFTIGERERSTDLLNAAVLAYDEALKERTRNRVPLQWATTQMNLGNALRSLGHRQRDTESLNAAVLAYREALKEFTRGRLPRQWAGTQMNLGNALLALGEQGRGIARLEDAVLAYSEALKERTQDRAPHDWAMTQMNLGNALLTIGQREPGTARLNVAMQAFSEALKEIRRDRMPLRWAMVQGNLVNVELAYFDKTTNPSHLATARSYALAAREVFVEAQAEHYVQMADKQLAKIAARTP
jgi:tetratricopeptide (TPR) repeat protein